MALKPLSMLHLVVVAMLTLLAMCQASSPDRLQLMADKHENWMLEFGRTYQDEEEKAMRLKVFRDNAAHIEAFNQQADKTYTLGLNKFSDLTNQEFLARYTGYVSGRRSTMKSSSSFKYADVKNIQKSRDWNKEGAVTFARDQGQCGCCWAFTAIAAVEGFNKIKTEKLISFSEQELLDCEAVGKFHDPCEGGSPDSAFQYIVGKKGNMTTRPDYPYQESRGASCRSAYIKSFYTHINSVKNVPRNNELALMEAVSMQPVAALIDPSGPNFHSYKEGVYSETTCGTNLTHTVAVVGYGEESDGTKYWLLKNSWGYSWGDNGYMKLQKDVDAAEGRCGIAMDASYPSEAD